MGKTITNGFEIAQTANLDEIDLFEMCKRLYLDWLRFFRANMTCEWECEEACPLPNDCIEIHRVWLAWLDTLDAEEAAILN